MVGGTCLRYTLDRVLWEPLKEYLELGTLDRVAMGTLDMVDMGTPERAWI